MEIRVRIIPDTMVFADSIPVRALFTPHVYRHYLTTTLRENNCTERVIRYIRGDAEHSIADQYDHLKWDNNTAEYVA